MTTDRSNNLIVQSVVDLGHKLGLSIVAEGVEDEEALVALRGFGCDIVQGYHLSRPVPAPVLDAWRRDRRPVPAPSPRALVAVTVVDVEYSWLGYVRATAEASLVGGLAEMDAVHRLAYVTSHPTGSPRPCQRTDATRRANAVSFSTTQV